MFVPTQQASNARIDAAGDNCGTDKLSIRIKLLPLASNELLDRPRILPFNVTRGFLRFIAQVSVLLGCEACLTLELTRAERRHSTYDARKHDESPAVEASG
jgi:hypothetical protein